MLVDWNMLSPPFRAALQGSRSHLAIRWPTGALPAARVD